MVDLSKHRGSGFITLEKFTRPQIKEIEGIVDGEKFGRPKMIFKDGTQLGLNVTNVNWLIETFGSTDGDALIGKKIELYKGQISYQGSPTNSILLRLPDQLAQPLESDDHEAAEAAIAARSARKKTPTSRGRGGGGGYDPMDDEIPFAPDR